MERRKLNTQDFGAAAVHLVCADLLLSGYRAFMAAEGLRYDVLLDLGSRIVRIQVKGTSKARLRKQRVTAAPLYQFVTRRNGLHGYYDGSQIDVLACIAVDIRVVAYLPVRGAFPKALHLYPPGTLPFIRSGEAQRLVIDQFPIERIIAGYNQ